MQILDKYQYANKYYARVKGDDDIILILSATQELADEEWEELYRLIPEDKR